MQGLKGEKEGRMTGREVKERKGREGRWRERRGWATGKKMREKS